MQLLEAAVASGNHLCIAAVSQLPAAAQLSSEQVMQLLTAAVTSGHQHAVYCIGALSRLPAAAQLSRAQVMQLLLLSLEAAAVGGTGLAAAVGGAGSIWSCYSTAHSVAVLCSQLSVAAQLSQEQAMQLLEAAVSSGHIFCVKAVGCVLPAAQQLSGAQLECVATAVARSGHPRGECILMLALLPAAVHLSSEQMLRLVDAAVGSGSGMSAADVAAAVHSMVNCLVDPASALVSEHELRSCTQQQLQMLHQLLRAAGGGDEERTRVAAWLMQRG
jgi:hypothetical protein